MSKSRGEVVVYAPRPMGRPTLYDPATAELICDLIAKSDRGLDFICDMNPELPTRQTVHRWLNAYPDFCYKYLRARESQADFIAEQCLEIADDAQGDYRTIETRKGPLVIFDAEHVQRAKLRIETRMRIAGKLHPKKWGDKIALTGPNGGPIQLEAVRERIAGKIASVRSIEERAEDPEGTDA